MCDTSWQPAAQATIKKTAAIIDQINAKLVAIAVQSARDRELSRQRQGCPDFDWSHFNSRLSWNRRGLGGGSRYIYLRCFCWRRLTAGSQHHTDNQ
jgi:hypothetical protein